MKKTGSELVVHALEQIGVKFTFGIPGVHTTEIYDALNNSDIISPLLVTHEGGAAFMADGVSRSSDTIGTIVIVPAAGTTHAMSGIGEAFLDGSPMLIISGGTRRDTGKHYQLHQIDLSKIVQGITKKYFLIEKHEDIISTIYEAYEIATCGEPGPVFVEIPVEIQMFQGTVSEINNYARKYQIPKPDLTKIKQAVDLLVAAKNPGIYVGWGAVDATESVKKLADALNAPVSTTLQGLSSFPANHPLHTGVGFGLAAIPAGQNAFKNCDCLLGVGVRFSELATGSFGVTVPENLIHIDINPAVFNKNYPAMVSIESDSKLAFDALLEVLSSRKFQSMVNKTALIEKIATDKKSYFDEWTKEKKNDIVSPGFFFRELRSQINDDAIMVVDDGWHTFLAAELFPVYQAKGFISPTDFNCMGFCIPASIGVKLSNPEKQVVAIVGDGAFLMTCMELLTAATHNLGIMVFVFHDGELGQISKFQEIPMNRKTCSIIGNVKIEGIAIATGCNYISINNDFQLENAIKEAKVISSTGKPVLVDVNIDYSKKTFLTKGVVKANLSRFPLNEKIRFIGRAIKRHILG